MFEIRAPLFRNPGEANTASKPKLRGPTIEPLEPRIALSATAEFGGPTELYRGSTQLTGARREITGLVPGQHVQIWAEAIPDDDSETPNVPDKFSITVDGRDTITASSGLVGDFVSAGSSLGVFISYSQGYDSGDVVKVSFKRQLIGNLTAVAPTQDGSRVQYGFRVDSSDAVYNVGGVRVRLYWVKPNADGTGWIRSAYLNGDGNVLTQDDIRPGTSHIWELTKADIRPPNESYRTLRCLVEPLNSTLETNGSDNRADTAITSLISGPVNFSSKRINFDNDGVQFIVSTDAASDPLYRSTEVVASFNAGETILKNIGKPRSFSPTAAKDYSFSIPYSDFPSVSSGATHLRLEVDPSNKVPETNEADERLLVELPDLTPTALQTGSNVQLGFNHTTDGVEGWYGDFVAKGTIYAKNGSKILRDAPLKTVTLGLNKTVSVDVGDLSWPKTADALYFEIAGPSGFPERNTSNNGVTISFPAPTIQDIPIIMRAKGWKVAPKLMDNWFAGAAAKRTVDLKGPDFNLRTDTTTIDLNWVQKQLDAGSKQGLNALTSLNLSDVDSIALLKDKVQALLVAQPNAQSVIFRKVATDSQGRINPRDFQALHSQQVKLLRIPGISLFTDLSELNGALNRFSFYMVPVGSATRDGADVRVTVSSVLYYAYDSYDFNPDDILGIPIDVVGLGSWAFPDKVSVKSVNPFDSWYNATNSKFDQWRQQTGRGRDYNIVSSIKTRQLATPLEFSFTGSVVPRSNPPAPEAPDAGNPNTPSGIPATPTDLKVAAVTPTTATLIWPSAATDVKHFEWMWSTDGTNFYPLPDATVAGNVTSTTIGGLSPSRSYWYQNRSVNDFGASAWSAPVRVNTPSGIPADPTNLAANWASTTSIRLTWNYVDPALAFRVDVRWPGLDWTGLMGVEGGGAARSVIVPGLQRDFPYQFRVVATGLYGRDSPGAVSVKAPLTP